MHLTSKPARAGAVVPLPGGTYGWRRATGSSRAFHLDNPLSFRLPGGQTTARLANAIGVPEEGCLGTFRRLADDSIALGRMGKEGAT